MSKINTTFKAIVPWSIRVRLPALIQAGAITSAVASFAPLMLAIAA